MNLRTRLLLAQAPLGLALVLVGALSVTTISSLGMISQAILKDNYQTVLAAQRMKEAIERIDDAALMVWAGQRETGLEQASEQRRRFEAELKVQEGNISEPGEREVTERLRMLWTSYQERLDRLGRMSDPDAARRFHFDQLKGPFVEVRRALDEILAMNQDAMVRKSDRARSAAERTRTVNVAAVIGALGLGVFASTVLTRRLLRPLSVLSQAARRIGEGDLEARANLPGTDELARLAADFNAMASQLAKYRRSSLGELLQAQQAAQAAIDSLADPVVVFGAEGEIRSVNRAAEGVLGLMLSPGGADPLSDLDPSVRSVLERLRAHVLGGKGPYVPRGFEEAVRTPSGEGERYLLPRASPVYEPEGGIVGATVVLQDVTRLRRFDDLRNDLVATVAHELRTPLTSLSMAVHLCAEEAAGPLTEKQADLLHAARNDCERLQGMVDDLLDLSRFEAGRIALHREPTSTLSLIEAALEAHRAVAEERGVRLSALPALDAGDVLVDRERVTHVFSNLIANAIRHTPAGGEVEVRARRLDGWVRCEVADTGEGIPAEYQQRVFEKFFRVPGAPSDGTGLGLSIAREIVIAHGGEIGVESGRGRGSTFWFTLPAATERPERAGAA